jgi:phosphopantetheinyl transferase (holo-ACP synthase)
VPLASWVSDGRWPHVGVDVVSLDRIGRAGERAVLRLICGADELAAAGAGGTVSGLHRAAATWAVKEAAIKAAGGRPAGFLWTSIHVTHDSAGAGPLAAFLGGAIRDITGSSSSGWCRYAWQLPVPDARGVAAWCAADGAVWAIAIDAPAEATRDCGSR